MSKPKRYRIFHVSPGLVQYESAGQEHLVLVKKDILDVMNSSFIGKPVFNENHKMIDASDAFDINSGNKEELADGVVHAAGYDDWSGRYWVDAMIWDAETQKNIDDGYGVSNAYVVNKAGPGGEYNSVPYDEEVLDAEYHHLAVVKNPRYSDTQIIQNSKNGGIMKFKLNWPKKKAEEAKAAVKENAADEEVQMNADATLEVDGETIEVSKMVEAYQNMKQAEADKKNATVGIDDTIEVDGESVSVKDLLEAFKMKTAAADDEKEEAPDVKENSKTESKNENFKVMENAASKTEKQAAPTIETERVRLARGKTQYGSVIKKEDANA